jgi:hypothetical protein
MQSSTLVALRTLVLLFCLVAVPAFALVGTKGWPQVWQKAVELAESSLKPAAAADSLEAPTGRAALPQSVPATNSTPETARGLSPTAMPAPPAGAQDTNTSSRNVTPRTQSPPPNPIERAVFDAPTMLSSWQAPPASMKTPVFWPTETETGGQVSPASFVASPASAALARAQDTTSPADNDKRAVEVERAMDQVQQRLQALGAVHYRLETAGPRGEQFYFRCTMALSSNPNYHRYFEATDGDPLCAMQQVLAQVEAWRSGR